MKAETAPVTQLILPLVTAIAATAMGTLAVIWFPSVNDYLSSQFQLVTGLEVHKAAAAAISQNAQFEFGFNCALVAAFSMACALAGYTLGTKATFAAVLQLFVLLLLCQWLLWNLCSLRCYPLAILIATTAALTGAKVLRALTRRTSSTQSHNYELMLRNVELTQARLQMVRKDEVERRLLAADLHDQVLNDLKTAKQNFSVYKEQHAYGTELHSETAAQIERLLVQAMEDIREVMDSLCPSVLEHLGLIAAVDECLRRACRTAGLKRRFNCRLVEDDLSGFSTTQCALIYRLIQESVNNACKHAGGKMLSINIEKVKTGKDGCGKHVFEEERLGEGRFEMIVQVVDDGKGIDLTAGSHDETRGIRYMKQRADLIGAKIGWHSNNNGANSLGVVCGTLVEIRVPLKPVSREEKK